MKEFQSAAAKFLPHLNSKLLTLNTKQPQTNRSRLFVCVRLHGSGCFYDEHEDIALRLGKPMFFRIDRAKAAAFDTLHSVEQTLRIRTEAIGIGIHQELSLLSLLPLWFSFVQSARA